MNTPKGGLYFFYFLSINPRTQNVVNKITGTRKLRQTLIRTQSTVSYHQKQNIISPYMDIAWCPNKVKLHCQRVPDHCFNMNTWNGEINVEWNHFNKKTDFILIFTEHKCGVQPFFSTQYFNLNKFLRLLF